MRVEITKPVLSTSYLANEYPKQEQADCQSMKQLDKCFLRQFQKRTPFVHLQFRLLPKTNGFAQIQQLAGQYNLVPRSCCNGNVSYNRLAEKGVGTRLPIGRPLPVGRLETISGREVCWRSGTTSRLPADYPLQGYRELAAIELPMRQDHKSITEACGGTR